MAPRVYAAARATRLITETSIESAWDQYTNMFRLVDGRNHSGTTFIYGGYPFTRKIQGDTDTVRQGDIYKATTVHKSEIYVEIVEWHLPDRFSYIEYFWNSDAAKPNDPDRTDFHFRPHPEGVMLEIIRREKSDIQLRLRDLIFGRKNYGGWASGRLTHILAGDGAGFDLKNGHSLKVREFSVTRVDSLRQDYSDTPMAKL